MKNSIIGFILLASLSFAQMPSVSKPLWDNYVSTCCQYYSVHDLAADAEGYYLDLGEGCAPASDYGLPWPTSEALSNMMWFNKANIYDAFQNVAFMCADYGEASPECLGSKSTYYMVSRSARSTFTSARLSYMHTARNSIEDYMSGACKDGVDGAYVRGAVMGAQETYRTCKAACTEIFGRECSGWCTIEEG